MRINVYAEEMTDRVEIVEKEVEGQVFTGLRLYMYLPVTQNRPKEIEQNVFEKEEVQVRGPFIHGVGDDDSNAITFWGKNDLRDVLIKALHKLDIHYAERRERERSTTPNGPAWGSIK